MSMGRGWRLCSEPSRRRDVLYSGRRGFWARYGEQGRGQARRAHCEYVPDIGFSPGILFSIGFQQTITLLYGIEADRAL